MKAAWFWLSTAPNRTGRVRGWRAHLVLTRLTETTLPRVASICGLRPRNWTIDLAVDGSIGTRCERCEASFRKANPTEELPTP